MKYLTRSYVEWLGLQEGPVFRGYGGVSYISEYAAKPLTGSGFQVGVKLAGHVYIKSPCGLSYDRV